MTANELLRDRVIEHAVYLERYTKRELVEVLAILEQANDSVIEKIARASVDISENAKQALLDEIRRAYAAAVDEMRKRFETEGKKLGQIELDYAKSLLESAPVSISFSMVTPEMLWSAVHSLPAASGTTAAELLDAYELGTAQKIVSAVRQGFVEGESIPEIIRRLRGTRAAKYADGVMQTTRRGAQTLAQTLTSHISNTAAHETYKENADLVKGEQWLATLDSATCPICGALDGKKWPIGEDHALPPEHPRCHCTIVPVLASWEELGVSPENIPEEVRTAMDGEYPGSTTYEDWLRRQPVALQEEILGIKRSELFRKGMRLDSMIDRGKLLTLEELGAKRPGRAA